MDRDLGLNQTIDYDYHKARAHELRRQEIDRLFERLVAWTRSLAGTHTDASRRLRSGNAARSQTPKLGLRGASDAHW